MYGWPESPCPPRCRLRKDTVNDPNSFENPEFLKDLEFINDQLSSAKLRQQRQLETVSINESPGLDGSGEAEVSSFNRELAEACLATGATGAAIALVRGEKIVCYATAGSNIPDIGVCLDPHNGLSGCCFQTRQLQHCCDTETDIRVDSEASLVHRLTRLCASTRLLVEKANLRPLYFADSRLVVATVPNRGHPHLS